MAFWCSFSSGAGGVADPLMLRNMGMIPAGLNQLFTITTQALPHPAGIGRR